MALETALKRLILLPGFIHGTASRVQTGNGEPRKAHWLGNRQSTPPQQDQEHGQQSGPPRRQDPRGYRDLASIGLGEVEDAIHLFQTQLVPSPVEGWIGKDYFCQLPLKRNIHDRPPLVFGRVKTIYPSEGQVQNLEEMEMYFPRLDGPPDVLHIHDYDISLQKPARSFCVGVKCYLSEGEMADFSASENIFIEKGFAPLYETGSVELLDVDEHTHAALPWLHVIGSGWFASIPDSLQPEIREQLRNLARWGTVMLNYHPRRYTLQLPSLNDELEFQYGFSEHYLIAPQNTGQTLLKLEESFSEIFMQGSL